MANIGPVVWFLLLAWCCTYLPSCEAAIVTDEPSSTPTTETTFTTMQISDKTSTFPRMPEDDISVLYPLDNLTDMVIKSNDDMCLVYSPESMGSSINSTWMHHNPITNGMMSWFAVSCHFKDRLLSSINETKTTGVHYNIPIGTNITLLCQSTEDTNCKNSSKYLTEHSTTIINTTTLNKYQTLFSVDFIEPTDNYIWMLCHCYREDGKKQVIGKFETYTSGEKPKNVTNFKCIVKEFVEVICSWDSQYDNTVNWTVCYGLRERWYRILTGSFWRTEILGYQNSFTMKMENSIPALYNIYLIQMNGSNAYGDVEFSFDYTLDQVLLETPVIELLEPTGSTNLTIAWETGCPSQSYYSTACRMNGLIYEINIIVDAKMTPDLEHLSKIYKAERNVTRTYKFKPELPIDNGTKIDIKLVHLLPYTDYNITMRQQLDAMPSVEQPWSDRALLRFKTNSTKPLRGPFFNKNGFEITDGNCEKSRRVNIFWKKLNIHNGGNGVITAYRYRDENITKPAALREMTTCIPNNRTRVNVYAANDQGFGETPSHIVIPKTENIVEVKSCTVRARQIGKDNIDRREISNAVIIDWKLLENDLQSRNISNVTYTIFWCKYVDNTCQDDSDWIAFPPAKSRYALYEKKLIMKFDPSEYRFGVSMHHQHRRSGIIWTNCLFGAVGPGENDVKFWVKRLNDTHASVEISPQCENSIGMIENIDFKYCEQSLLDETDKCRGEVYEQKSVTTLCKKMFYIRINTKQEFIFWLTLTYVDKPGVVDTVKKTFEKSDQAKIRAEEQKRVIIAATLASAAFVIIVVIAVGISYIQRKRRSTIKMRVTTIQPELISDPIKEDTESLNGDGFESDEHEEKMYWAYKTAVEPLLPQIHQLPNGDHDLDSMRQHSGDSSFAEKRKLVHQISVESDHSMAARSRNGHLSEDESAYGTGTDNSGDSLGYRPVTSSGFHPREMMLSEDLEGDDDCQGGKAGFNTGGSTLSDLLRAGDSGASSVFHGRTLENLMQNSSSDTENNNKYAKWMAGCDSGRSVPRSLGCAYLKVDDIVEEEEDENRPFCDYLHVNQTDTLKINEIDEDEGVPFCEYLRVESTEMKKNAPSSVLPVNNYTNVQHPLPQDVLAETRFINDPMSSGVSDWDARLDDKSGVVPIDLARFLNNQST